MHTRSTRLALWGLLVGLPAAATVVIAQTYEELAHSSPLIVKGTIGQVQSAWAPQERTIETWVEVQVQDVLKGRSAPGAVLMVRTPGGRVGNVAAHVSGAPRFATGEEAVLFLEPAADTAGVWLISGLAAGKVTLLKDQAGSPRAVRDVRGLTFYERSAGAPKLQQVHQPEDLGTAEAFIARVKKAVAR